MACFVRNVQAIIFVVDSCDKLRIVVAKDELDCLLQHQGLYLPHPSLNF